MRFVMWVGLLASSIVFAQTLGSINGVVNDPSGGAVPNAAVTVINTATNVARSTTTDSAGLYSFPDLQPGKYDVKVMAPGFNVTVKANVEIQVQQAGRVDFTLAVGQSTETIEVAANAAQLTTENATVGTVIEEQRIVDLPLNGRSFFSLVALSPNVNYGFTPAQQASSRLGGSRSTLTIAMSGARATWSNYTLDGITNTDVDFNTYVLQPSVDALQEFKVQSGIYPAEFGREAGQVNVSSKPGSNSYHGSAWEFLRNDVLDARSYDFLSASRSATNPSPARTPYRQNQYGYTLGGPVWIPKLLHGKNRLFFMSNFEGYKSRQTVNALATTMTAAMRTGDFSAVSTVLQDPMSRTGTYPNIVASPFPGNQIPGNRISSDSQTLLKFYPAPNQPAKAGLPLNNYQYGAKTPVNKNNVTERIDFNESSKSQWFGRYSWTNENTTTPGITTNDGSVLYTRASQWVLSNVRVISPTKVNEARFGYNSLFNNITQQLAGVENVDQELNIPVQVTDKNSWGIPSIQMANNLSSFGNPTSEPFQINDRIFQGVDNFSWVIGKHSLRMGGEYRYDEYPQVGNEFPRGQFFFNGQFTNTVSAVSQTGGYAGADFLMGYTDNTIIAVALASADDTNNEWASYIDDTWRVASHLTISAGMRWEVAQPMLDKSGNEVSVDLTAPLSPVANAPLDQHPVYVRAGSGNFYDGINFRYQPYYQSIGATVPNSPPLQTVRDGRLGARLVNTSYLDFAPRLGIAYSPSNKWSFRTGFGIFYSQESKNSIFDNNRGLGGRTGQVTPTTYGQPTFTYTNFINSAQLPATIPIGLTWGANPHLPTTYSMQYIFNVQRTLGQSTTLEVGYNGSQSRHLDDLINAGQPVPGTAAVVTRMPYPEFGSQGIQYLHADGTANFNGMAVKLTQRFGNNLSSLLAYTYSRSLDDGSAIRGPGNDFVPENSLCPHTCEWGPSDFNVPQRFVASVLYTLPFGRGQKLLNHGGVVDEVVGHWQLSTITTLQSGSVTETATYDSAGIVFSPTGERLSCYAGIPDVLPNPSQTGWFNPKAFYNNAAGTFGTCGRDNLRGPRQTNIDFSVIKDFPIHESHALQFRMEMFNAPNHVELGTPSASWNGSSSPTPPSSFGTITGTRASMRQIQLALRYNF